VAQGRENSFQYHFSCFLAAAACLALWKIISACFHPQQQTFLLMIRRSLAASFSYFCGGWKLLGDHEDEEEEEVEKDL